jgi:outer membrane receptor protein involved in Fe transport
MALAGPQTAHAQGPDAIGARASAGPANELRPMSLEDLLSLPTVTGSGGEVEERASSAANVVFIGRAEMARNGWQSIGEALASVPGLYLIDSGTGPSIGVRGVTGGVRAGTRLVKVMINGVAVNFRPDLRAFLGPEYLPVAAVERIEIAMGPLSSLYGANAFIATVNVITRAPTPGTVVEAAAGAEQVTGALPGWRASALATHGGPRATLLLAASTASLDRSGRRVEPTFDGQDLHNGRLQSVIGEPSRDDRATPTSAFAQLRLLGSGLTFTTEGGVQRLDASPAFELNATLTHDSREALTNAWLASKLEAKPSERHTLTLAGGVAGGAPTREDVLFLTDSRTRSFRRNFGYRAVDGSLTWLLSLGSRLSLRLGVDAELDREDVLYYTAIFNQPEGIRRAGDSLDLIGERKPRQQWLSDLGADLQLSGAPLGALPALRLTASARVDRVSYGAFGPPLQPSWRVAATYNWAQSLYAKLIVGKAFQAPSGVLMFAEPGFGAASNIIGNLNATGVPALRPQTIESAELVLYGLVAGRAALEASVFYQVLRDKIEFRSGGTDYVARNGGATSYTGAEGAAHFDLGPCKPFLTGAAVARLSRQKLLLAAPAAYPNLVATAGSELALLAERLILVIRARYVGRRGATPSNVIFNLDQPYSLAPFTTVDATATAARLYLLGERSETRFMLSATNLLDQRWSEPGFGGYDLPSLGRRVLFEMRQAF